MMSKKTIIILAIPLIILTVAPLSLPETPEELKETGSRTLQLFPGVLKEVWRGFLDSLWTMWDWLKTFFNSYFGPFFQNILQERKEIISQELEKEKESLSEEIKSLPHLRWRSMFEEIKTILSKFPKSLWERIKAFIR